MARVVWSETASQHLDEIRAYIERFDPAAGASLGARLLALGQSLDAFPNRGRPSTNGARELVTVPPYVLRYVVRGDVVTILGVRHGRRRPIR